jgi:4'-phosphopantetheinyl transferase
MINIREVVPNRLLEELEQIISKEKRKRIKKFKFQEDYLRSLYGEVCIRKVVSETVGISPAEIIISRNGYGKPYIENVPDLHFNISHAGDWVACIVSANECGIDIEHVKDIDLKIAERFFHEDEYSFLTDKRGKERTERFFELWTLKESYVKYKGKGLQIPLNSFSVTYKNGGYAVIPQTENLTFSQYDWDDEYKVAACTVDKVQKIAKISITELI